MPSDNSSALPRKGLLVMPGEFATSAACSHRYAGDKIREPVRLPCRFCLRQAPSVKFAPLMTDQPSAILNRWKMDSFVAKRGPHEFH
jgi:hypothetical protein